MNTTKSQNLKISAKGGSAFGGKTNEGFTLVEILVAMLILAIGMMALISLLNYGFVGTKKAENKMGVLNFARQKLEEIEDMNFYYIGAGNPGYKDINLNSIKDSTESALTGTTHIGNVNVSWAVDVQSIDDSADGSGAFDSFGNTTDYKKMIITLNWSDQKGAAQHQVLQTFVGPRLLSGADNIGPSFICSVTPSISGAGTVTINVSASEMLGAIPVLTFTPAYGTAYQGSAISVLLVEASDYNESINNFTYTNATPVTISQGNPADPTDGTTPDGIALINVSGIDDTGNPGTGTGTFIIDTTPPQVVPPPVVVTSTPVEAGNAVTIQVEMTDSLSVVSPLLWYQSGPSSFSTTSLTMLSGSVTDGTWSGSIPASYILDRDPLTLLNDIEYYFEARDGAGNSGSSLHYYFGVKDTTPPVIITTPVLVAIESTIVTLTATMTDFMGVDSSGTGPNVRYKDVASTFDTTVKMSLISGTLNSGNWQASIPATAIRDWSGDSGYDVDYNIIVWDSAVNSAASPGASSFNHITVIGSDTTPPALSNLKPVNGSTNMSLDTTISGIFSEAMIETTVTSAGNVQLLQGGVTVVPASITYNPVNFTFTLTPSSSLSYQTTYTAVVTTGVKDIAGNSMSAQQTWAFTTVNAPIAQYYFHKESSPVNSSYKRLAGVAPDVLQETTKVVGSGGDYVYGEWLVDTAFVNPSGNWTFTVWATDNHNQIEGSFYARLYYYTSGALFRDTAIDNENIKTFTGTYHAYTWTENISSGAINDRLIVRIVFKATVGKSTKTVTVGYDNSSKNSNVFITFSP